MELSYLANKNINFSHNTWELRVLSFLAISLCNHIWFSTKRSSLEAVTHKPNVVEIDTERAIFGVRTTTLALFAVRLDTFIETNAFY